MGLSHNLVLSPNAYLKSTIAAFGKREREGIYILDPRIQPDRIYADEELSIEMGLRGHITLNQKVNQHHLFQTGISGSILSWIMPSEPGLTIQRAIGVLN